VKSRYFVCALLAFLALPSSASAQTYTIIDDGDPGTSFIGSWTVGTWGAIYGSTKHYHTGIADVPDNFYTWSLDLPVGDYEIEFWVNNGGYVDHTHYSLSSDGGASTLNTWASQYNVGDGWHNLLANSGLARFYCNGTTSVTVNNGSGGVVNGNIVVADAIRFYGPFAPATPPTPTATPIPLPTATPGLGDIYVESVSDGQNHASYAEIGAWAGSSLKSTAEGLTGTSARYMIMTWPNRSARFLLPTPAVPGIYDVFLTWPASAAATTKAYWRVHHAAGDAESGTYVDQTQNANIWVHVGRYNMRPGFSYVSIGGKSGDAADVDTGRNCYSDSAKFTGPLIVTGFDDDSSWEVYR